MHRPRFGLVVGAFAALTVLAFTVISPVDASSARRHRAIGRPSSPTPSVTAAGRVAQVPQPPTSAEAVQSRSESAHVKAYAGIFKDNTVAVLDVAAGRVLSTIPVPAGPHGMAISRDGSRVFVSSDGSSVVSVIDTRTDKVIDTIDVGATPHGVALSPDGRLLLVAVFDAGIVAFIDVSSDTVIARVPVASPHNIAIAPNGNSAYVASQKSGSAALVLLDVARRSVIGNVALDRTPRALNFSPDGHELLFTVAGSNDVQVLNPLTDQVTGQVSVGASPHHPTFTSDGRVALVVSQTTGELSVIRPRDNTIAATISVGKLPHWIATTSDSSVALVTNEGSNSVDVVDLQTNKIRASIAVGNGPRKVVVQPGSLGPTSSVALATAPTAIAASTVVATIAAPTTQGATGPTVSVSIAGFAFVPPSLTITAGSTVAWNNTDGVPHTVTAAGFGSGDLINGATYRHTFTAAGTYTYRCSIHPSMTASIIVTG